MSKTMIENETEEREERQTAVELAEQYKAVMLEIEEALSFSDDGVVPDELWDKLMAVEKDCDNKFDNIARVIKSFDRKIASLDGEIDYIQQDLARVKSRKQSLENNKSRLKDYTLMAMNIYGKDKVKTPYVTLFKKETKAIEVTDESQVPKKYFNKKIEYKLDKKACKDWIEQGHRIKGVELRTNTSLQIR